MENLHNLENENFVLGSLILKPQLILELDFLKEEHFYNNKNKIIYRHFITLFNDFVEFNYLTIFASLKKNGDIKTVQLPYIISLTENLLYPPSELKFYANYIVDDFIKRETLAFLNSQQKKIISGSGDISDVLTGMQDFSYDILNTIKEDSTKHVQDIAKVFVQSVRELGENDIVSYKTNYRSLDNDLRLKSGQLVIVAGGTSHGKSVFALNLASNFAKQGLPVGFFSLEMTNEELTNRLVSNEESINNFNFNFKLSSSDLTKYDNSVNKFKDVGIYVNDKSSLNVFEFKSLAKKMIAKNGVKIIFLDYLQLMTGTSKRNASREQEIAQITRGLKIAAKELNVPIIALSQLSREFEKQNRKPKLSDLRESGAIEQDSDTVMFVYNFKKAGLTKDETGAPIGNEIAILVEKQRGGRIFETNLQFDGQYQRISDIGQSDLLSNTLESNEFAINTDFDKNELTNNNVPF